MHRTIALLLISLAGCAATYKPPVTVDTVYSEPVKSDPLTVLRQAKKTLMLDGFQIMTMDTNEMFISTAPKDWKLSVKQANCGTTFGINYLKDKRTHTWVAINVMIDDGQLIIKPSISGEYKPGRADQDINLTCVSTGEIEKTLAQKINH